MNKLFPYIYKQVSDTTEWIIKRKNISIIFVQLILFSTIVQISLYIGQYLVRSLPAHGSNFTSLAAIGTAVGAVILLFIGLSFFSALNGFFIDVVRVRFLAKHDLPKIASKQNVKVGVKYLFANLAIYIGLYVVLAIIPIPLQEQIFAVTVSIFEVLLLLYFGIRSYLKEKSIKYIDFLKLRLNVLALPLLLQVGTNFLSTTLSETLVQGMLFQIFAIPLVSLLIAGMVGKE